ncbi:hypothetical protein [Balneatrix alpica]|uniref:Uncharacterized protein n=1 Tax=Balneatrix alpica TaxID=75684 RepID=A0ABV5ZB14_9GAMM|nr:hypothetical protein [Balneatrix alpica]
MNQHTHFALLFAVTLGAASVAMAETPLPGISEQDYLNGKAEIAQAYQENKRRCDELSGNTKDICVKEADGRAAIAMAQLDAAFTPSTATERKVGEAKAAAEYALALEQCDDYSGQQQADCQAEAEADYARAQANLTPAPSNTEPTQQTPLLEQQAKAAERCEALPVAEQELCMAEIRLRFDS